MSEREKWMPMLLNVSLMSMMCKVDVEQEFLSTGLRAQIAAFEEFRADTASGHARDRMDAKIKELQAQLGGKV